MFGSWMMLTRAAYDETADGFTFSRSRAKKVKEPKVDTTSDSTARPPPSKSKRISNEGMEPRRRSARLSGEKLQSQPAPEQQIPKAQPAPEPQIPHEEPRGRQREKTPVEAPLHVDKKRRTTKIALPFADTPVILRNKAMRMKTDEKHRRSSSSLRGRRASSLIDSGLSNGELYRWP